MSLLRRRMTMASSVKEPESEWAFSFNIEVAKGSSWTANAEQLVQINKMFAIITNFIGMKGGDFYQDNAPQEFDLRINNVRNFYFFYSEVSNESDVFDILYAFTDGDGTWFSQMSLPWNNPITNTFNLYSVQ